MKNKTCSSCGSSKYYCRGLCKKCYIKQLIPVGWSKNYSMCVSCGLTEFPHVAKGLCRRCYTTQITETLCACGCGLPVSKSGNKTKQFRKGHWMKGNLKFAAAHLRAMTGKNNPQYGKFGKDHPAFGHATTDKTREERRQRRLKALSTRTDKRTGIEVILSNLLDSLSIIHQSQCVMYNKFTVDEYLPKYGIVIEAFGGYWHGDTRKFKTLTARQIRSQKEDATRIKYLNTCGHPVLVLWEKELNENPEWCKEQIIDIIR